MLTHYEADDKPIIFVNMPEKDSQDRLEQTLWTGMIIDGDFDEETDEWNNLVVTFVPGRLSNFQRYARIPQGFDLRSLGKCHSMKAANLGLDETCGATVQKACKSVWP